MALDEGDLAFLALRDLSAAFDTIDHEVLLQRLHITYGVNGVAHDWSIVVVLDRSPPICQSEQASRLRSSSVPD